MSCCCRNHIEDRDPDRNCVRDPGPDCCHPDNPFACDKRICCDGSCCGLFDEDRRDCFWPDFTHPRSLCCRILYGCPRNEADEDGIFDDREDPDDEEECKCKCKCKKQSHCGR